MKRYLAALACCGLLSLSGCSDDSSSSTDPPSPTPSTSAPTSTPTEEGETPEEFLDRWIGLNTSMQNTGDVAEFREISAKCTPCLDTADQVESIYKAGGYVKTAGWTAKKVKVSDPGDDGSVRLTIDVQSAPTRYKESADDDLQKLTGGSFRELMTLSPEGASWIVTNLEQLAE